MSSMTNKCVYVYMCICVYVYMCICVYAGIKLKLSEEAVATAQVPLFL